MKKLLAFILSVGMCFACVGCGDKPTNSTNNSHSKDCNGQHDYKLTSIVDATCQAEGKNNYECEVCGETYSSTIAKVSHDYTKSGIIEPTCFSIGVTYKQCKWCTSKEPISTTDAFGHNFNSTKRCVDCGIGNNLFNFGECDATLYSTHGVYTSSYSLTLNIKFELNKPTTGNYKFDIPEKLPVGYLSKASNKIYFRFMLMGANGTIVARGEPTLITNGYFESGLTFTAPLSYEQTKFYNIMLVMYGADGSQYTTETTTKYISCARIEV